MFQIFGNLDIFMWLFQFLNFREIKALLMINNVQTVPKTKMTQLTPAREWIGLEWFYWRVLLYHPDRKVLNSKVNDLRQQKVRSIWGTRVLDPRHQSSGGPNVPDWQTNSELQTNIWLVSLSLCDHLRRKSLIQIKVYRKWVSFRTKKSSLGCSMTCKGREWRSFDHRNFFFGTGIFGSYPFSAFAHI